MIDAQNYQTAYRHIRQVSFGLIDMAWHTVTAPVTEDVARFEQQAAEKTQLLPRVEGQCMSTAFGHILQAGMLQDITATNGLRCSMRMPFRCSMNGEFSTARWPHLSGMICWKRAAQRIR